MPRLDGGGLLKPQEAENHQSLYVWLVWVHQYLYLKGDYLDAVCSQLIVYLYACSVVLRCQPLVEKIGITRSSDTNNNKFPEKTCPTNHGVIEYA